VQSAGYLSYSEADFEGFRPTGVTRCINGDEIWHRGGDVEFHPHWCNDKGIGPPKLKFLVRFDQNVEYKHPEGAYPLHIFHKICRVCTLFQDALAVKILLDLLKGLWSYGVFKLMGSGYPKFSAPPVAKLCIRPPKVLEVQEHVRRSLSPCQVWWGSDFTRRWGGQKRWVFCLSVCLSVMLLNVRVCAPDFTMKALDYRNDFDTVG